MTSISQVPSPPLLDTGKPVPTADSGLGGNASDRLATVSGTRAVRLGGLGRG